MSDCNPNDNPVIVDEDLVHEASSLLEKQGFREGVDFLVNGDGLFLCDEGVNTGDLTRLQIPFQSYKDSTVEDLLRGTE